MKHLYVFILVALFASIAELKMSITQAKNQVGQFHFQSQRKLQEASQSANYALDMPFFQYAGILFYIMAFRIVGMQNLLAWQVFQLYQNTLPENQQKYFEIGNFVHGYSNQKIFAWQGFGFGLMFQQFNIIWEICIFLFIVCVFFRHILAPWCKNKALRLKQQEVKSHEINSVIFEPKLTQETQINLLHSKSTLKNLRIFEEPSDSFPKDTESAFKPSKKIIEYQFSENSEKNTLKQGRENQKVKNLRRSSIEATKDQSTNNFQSKIKTAKSLVYERDFSIKHRENEQHNFLEPLQLEQKSQSLKLQKKQAIKRMSTLYKRFKKLTLVSNVILKQVVFYMLINSLTVICFTGVYEVLQNQDSISSSLNLSFSACMIAVSVLVMFFYTLKLVLEKGKGSGEVKSKFANFTYANKVFLLMAIAQRMTYAFLIGSEWNYAIAVVCGLKLVVMIVSKFAYIWAKESDYYRNLGINFVQLLIFIVLTLDKYYFSTIRKVNLSKESIAFILLALFSIAFILTFGFLLKDIGLFYWVSKKLKVFPVSSEIRNTSIVLEPYTINDIIQKDEKDQTKRVKFFEPKPDIQTSKASKKTINSTKNFGSSLKHMSSLKSIGIINQSEIKPSIKPSVQGSQKQISSRFVAIDSETTVQNQINSAHETQIPSKIGTPRQKMEIKTHKQINRFVDDAQRAQRTHKIIIQELKQNQNEGSQNDDAVSIRMVHGKK